MSSITPVNNSNSSNLVCRKRGIGDISSESDSNDLVDSVKKLKLSSEESITVFEKIHLDIVKEIFKLLTPKEALEGRRVCKFFAKWLGDDDLWKFFYQKVGLDLSALNKSDLVVPLAKGFFRWSNLQKLIQSEIEIKRLVADQRSIRSIGCSILTVPEFSPLHSFVLDILKKTAKIPTHFNVADLFLNVLNLTEKFSVYDGVYFDAIEALANFSHVSTIRKELLDIMFLSDGSSCQVIAKALVPYLNEEEVQDTILKVYKKFGYHRVKSCLDVLITHPNMLYKILKIEQQSIDKVFKSNINNPVVFDELLRLLNQKDKHEADSLGNNTNPIVTKDMKAKIISTFMRIVDEVKIEVVICEAFADFQHKNNLCEKEIVNTVLKRFRDEIPEFRTIIALKKDLKNDPDQFLRKLTETFLKGYEDKIPKFRIILKLIKTLENDPDQFLAENFGRQRIETRWTTATILAPYVRNNPKLQSIFIKQFEIEKKSIKEYCGFRNIDAIILMALAELGFREDIINILKECANSKDDDLKQLAIYNLISHVSKKEIRSFLIGFVENKKLYGDFYWNIIDSLSVYIEEKEVQDLFLRILSKEMSCSYKIMDVVINALIPFEKKFNLKNIFLERLSNQNEYSSPFELHMRALCSNPKDMLMSKNELVQSLYSSEKGVRIEARKALLAYINA